MKRILTALVLIPLVTYAMLWAPYPVFLVVLAAIATLCFYEYGRLVALHSVPAPGAFGYAAGLLFLLLPGHVYPNQETGFLGLVVLLALALGRDPLSLRMLAVAAFIVMLFWPEAVVGPSFQMSFGSVIAIIAFDSSAPGATARRAYAALRSRAVAFIGGMRPSGGSTTIEVRYSPFTLMTVDPMATQNWL